MNATFTDSGSNDPLPKVWDENTRIGDMLKGKRGLVVGVAVDCDA